MKTTMMIIIFQLFILFQPLHSEQNEDNDAWLYHRDVKESSKPTGPTENIAPWGIGIISVFSDSFWSEGLEFPKDSIAVYSSPNRDAFGAIMKKANWDVILSVWKTQEQFHINGYDYRTISYDGSRVIYSQIDDEFVKILDNTCQSNVWVKVSDLRAAGFYPQSWQDHLTTYKTEYFAIENNKLMLWGSHKKERSLLTKIEDRTFAIRLTGEIEDGYCKAIVIKYDSELKHERKEIKRWMGWLKVINDKGHPLIWYYPMGC